MSTREKPRVLLVGEDVQAVEAAAAMLGPHAVVVTSASPRRAIELVEKEGFDVVCADAEMRGMSTPEMFRRMMAVLGHVGYLMFTTPAAYAKGAADGRWHVIFKPVDPTKLVAAVLQLARIAQMRRSVADLARVRTAGG